MPKDNNPIKGLTVAQLIEQLQQCEQTRIVFVEGGLSPFMLKFRKERFYKHPELDDTIIRADTDSPDYNYIVSNYIPVDTIILSQDK